MRVRSTSAARGKGPYIHVVVRTQMRIDRLTLRSFRNYRDTTVTFPAAGAYITGANGSGKTNLLEAIYFLANQNFLPDDQS